MKIDCRFVNQQSIYYPRRLPDPDAAFTCRKAIEG